MKTFWKIFTVAFLTFVMLFSGVIWSFNRFMKDDFGKDNRHVVRAEDGDDHFKDIDLEGVDELLRAALNSKRINAIFLGLDGTRSDTMMFVSFDPEKKKVDVISIPRDTYYPRKGYSHAQKKKINSVYGDHGPEGVKEAISDLLFNIPIHHYVTITYKGTEAIIDSIGGVPVYIPQRMIYDDPYDDPPLHIRFEPGHHVLNGADSVKFLRYRKANEGSGGLEYPTGDLGRVQAQQEFMKSAIKKALGFRLPNVAMTAFRHVRTDMQLQELVRYATAAITLDTENVSTHTLPGEAAYRSGGSFYFHDGIATRNLLMEIYEVDPETTENEENKKSNE